MSMNFNPYYGLSVKDTAYEVGMDGDEVLKTFRDIISNLEDVESEIFYEFFLIEDEFDDKSDYIYGIETYDISNDIKYFNTKNSGDYSFIKCIWRFIECLGNFNTKITEKNKEILLNYYGKIQVCDLTPKIYSVYI